MRERQEQEREPVPAHVTHRDVYRSVTDLRHEIQDNFVTKSELRMWVVLGIVGGQGVAAAVTSLITRMSPAAQVAFVYARIKGLV